ncbi:hypothetical protein, partial [Trichormus variabilis]|uniref:hypothetical protein n=1 Tax=Anabaena variabilis TaxID=264691 RepID=UPI001A9272CF
MSIVSCYTNLNKPSVETRFIASSSPNDVLPSLIELVLVVVRRMSYETYATRFSVDTRYPYTPIPPHPQPPPHTL